MKELFRERDFARVGYYQSILEAEGIHTHVRNRDLVSMTSDIPIPEFFPALCVVNDEDYEDALAILRDYTQGSNDEAADGGNDADAPAVIPFETKGIVFAGVAIIFGILFLSALTGFLMNIGSIADPEPQVWALASAGIVMAVSVFAVIKVGLNYRATRRRTAIEG